jgi:hypothetical protein
MSHKTLDRRGGCAVGIMIGLPQPEWFASSDQLCRLALPEYRDEGIVHSHIYGLAQRGLLPVGTN